ncbi:unnamed protein product [Didymodactylos carnosus]|uniref:RING-type E3 ubiquitin transferase n=1 Tax=Didymodactylos carnosus TaxID=1234261 RepID=A0A814FT11_9BILA|nr:unnamed protein product [Didymodactylos carnosus]CAF0987912.1 unnamed protein product [Didymodactylos carnosus]CAF3545800.1 unnamed protein product [Didymodactylos carnosus]CAF3760083.1 unnamed protein product [Didymodactylos carnosus]
MSDNEVVLSDAGDGDNSVEIEPGVSDVDAQEQEIIVAAVLAAAINDESMTSSSVQSISTTVQSRIDESMSDFVEPQYKRLKVEGPAATTATVSATNLNETESDTETCPICLEEFTNSGLHRVVVLKCGHLFGKNCIEKWLKNTPKCPHCQRKAKKTDVRPIYCRALKVLDTSERDQALKELEKEKKLRRQLQFDVSNLHLQYQIILEQYSKLQSDHMILLNSGNSSHAAASRNSMSLPSTLSAASTTTPVTFNITLEKVVTPSEQGGCRILSCLPSQHWLFVSQPSPSPQLFPGYGIRKISLLDGRVLEYIPIHQNLIRDVAVKHSAIDEGLILTCSVDKTLRISSYHNKSCLLTCNCSSPVWSCSWNNDDENLLYAGLNSGIVQVFDRRNPSASVDNLNFESQQQSPIVSLQYVQKNLATTFPQGILVGSMGKSCFYEYNQNTEYRYHALPLDKSLSSLHYVSETNQLLASFRPSETCTHTRHQLYELSSRPIENNESMITLNLIRSFDGSKVQKLLSRSKISIRNEQSYIISPDEETKGKPTIKLTSNDAQTFEVSRDFIKQATTIKEILDGAWTPYLRDGFVLRPIICVREA